MEAEFINILLTITDIVRPTRLPQGSPLPGIVVTRVSGGPLYVTEGGAGLEKARFQVDCWGIDYTEVKLLAASVVSLLDQYRDATFSMITLDAERDMSESGANAAEYPMRISLDFIVWKRG